MDSSQLTISDAGTGADRGENDGFAGPASPSSRADNKSVSSAQEPVSIAETSVSATQQQCIGLLEHHLHSSFAEERVTGDGFVYCPPDGAFAELDEFCEEQTMDEPRAPLVLLGESGVGKSALLANWLLRRQQNASRMRQGNDTFVFWHVVGCSRQSTHVSQLLLRLMKELQAHFELREVTTVRERLSWELPRYLDMAAKKGRIIIIVDGINRLGVEDSEPNLKWLPLKFPANVRVVLTATTPAGLTSFVNDDGGSVSGGGESLQSGAYGDVSSTISAGGAQQSSAHAAHGGAGPGDGASNGSVGGGRGDDGASVGDGSTSSELLRRDKILMELERRKWTTTWVQPLPISLRKLIAMEFLKSTATSDNAPAGLQNDFFITQQGSAYSSVEAGKNELDEFPGDEIRGLVLFPEMLHKLIETKATSNPLFLRVILKALAWSASRGFDLWEVLDMWTEAPNTDALYSAILDTWERGHQPTKAGIEEAVSRANVHGGFAALRDANTWHPQFKPQEKDVGVQRRRVSAASLARQMPSFAAAGGDGGAADNQDLSHGIVGDEQWVFAQMEAEKKLVGAKVAAETEVDDTVQAAMQRSESAQASRQERRAGSAKAANGDDEYSELEDEFDEDDSAEDIDLVGVLLEQQQQQQQQQGQQQRGAATESKSQPGSKGSSHSGSDEKKESKEEELASRSSGAEGKQGGTSDSSAVDDGGEDDGEDETDAELLSAAVNTAAAVSGQSTAMAPDDSARHPRSRSLAVEHHHRDPHLMPRQSSAGNLLEKKSRTELEGTHALPPYLRGGESVQGLGNLVGYAMALLYVARHGLRDSELWRILITLQESETLYHKIKDTDDYTEQRLIMRFLRHKTRLAYLFQSFDTNRDGVVTPDEFGQGLLRLEPTMKKSQIKRLMEIVDVDKDGVLDYDELFGRFETKVRALRAKNMREARQANGQVLYDDDPFHLVNTSNLSVASLGPDVEEAILSVLQTFGMIYSPREQVFVFPPEAEALRSTVVERYISPTGVDRWHLRLVRYFQRRAPSLRRCEELPWHLLRVRKWNLLKECMVDLETFELMSGSHLKQELMDYWRKLTAGPLPTSVESQAESANGHGDLNETTVILSQLDMAAVLGLSETKAKQRRMHGLVATFDLVDEYNHSIENWVARNHPSTIALTRMLHAVSWFLFEFSLHCIGQAQMPFLRVQLNYQRLGEIGVDASPPVFAIPGAGAAGGGSAGGAGRDSPQHGVGGGPSMLTNADSSYAAPGMGPGGTGGIGGSGGTGGGAGGAGVGGGVGGGGGGGGGAGGDLLMMSTMDGPGVGAPPATAANRRTAAALEAIVQKLYYYQRWMWIQFPWLALAQASALLHRDSIADSSRKMIAPGNALENSTTTSRGVTHAGVPGAAGSTATDGGRAAAATMRARSPGGGSVGGFGMYREPSGVHGSVESMGGYSSVSNDRRYWMVKKMDPRLVVPSAGSVNRLRGYANATLRGTSTTSNMYDSIVRDMVDEDERKARIGASKTSRSLEEHALMSEGIPFSDVSLRSRKHGTRFPSVEVLHREQLHKRYEEDIKQFPTVNPERFGGFPPPPTLHDVIAQKEAEEDVDEQNAKRAAFPDSPRTKECNRQLNRKTKLRRIYDRLVADVRAKQVEKQELELRLAEREYQDQCVCHSVEQGEQVIGMLEQRHLRMQQAVEDAAKVGRFYERVARVAQEYPPKVRRHLKVLEQELSLARQQCKDLYKCRRKLYVEREDIETRDMRRLELFIRHYQQLRKSLRGRLEAQRKAVNDALGAQNEDDEEALYGNAGQATSVQENSTNTFMAGLQRRGSSLSQSDVDAATNTAGGAGRGSRGGGARGGTRGSQTGDLDGDEESVSTLSVLDQVEARAHEALEKLYDVTGTIDPQELVEKIRTNDELTDSLRTQQKLTENRLNQLRAEHAAIQQEFEDVQLGSGEDMAKHAEKEGQSRLDVKRLDEQLFQAEMRTNQHMRKLENAQRLMHTVRTGAFHLANICEAAIGPGLHIRDKKPPAVTSDEHVSKLLSWCEDCVIAISEALVLETTQQIGDVNKSLPERQAELARAMVVQKRKTETQRKGRLYRKQRNKINASTEVFTDPTEPVASPRSVRVSATHLVDKEFEQALATILDQQDQKAEKRERNALMDDSASVAEGVRQFLDEALKTSDTNTELRRANHLADRKQGKASGYGWAVECLLQEHPIFSALPVGPGQGQVPGGSVLTTGGDDSGGASGAGGAGGDGTAPSTAGGLGGGLNASSTDASGALGGMGSTESSSVAVESAGRAAELGPLLSSMAGSIEDALSTYGGNASAGAGSGSAGASSGSTGGGRSADQKSARRKRRGRAAMEVVSRGEIKAASQRARLQERRAKAAANAETGGEGGES